MDADLDPSLPLWRRHHRPRRPHGPRQPSLEDRLTARILAPRLDRELAEPGGLALSEAHAARGVQLMSKQSRRSVARRLDRLIERVDANRTSDAGPLVASLAARLRSGEALDPRGVARLKTLLNQHAGSYGAWSRTNALTATLREASALLRVSPLPEPSGELARTPHK